MEAKIYQADTNTITQTTPNSLLLYYSLKPVAVVVGFVCVLLLLFCGGYLFFKQSGVGLMYSITSISIDQFYCNRNTYEMTVTQEIKYTTANFFSVAVHVLNLNTIHLCSNFSSCNVLCAPVWRSNT